MTDYRFVEHLPDLIHPQDYVSDAEGRRLRLQIRPTSEGVEILGDAMRPKELERLLESLDPAAIESMLCG